MHCYSSEMVLFQPGIMPTRIDTVWFVLAQVIWPRLSERVLRAIDGRDSEMGSLSQSLQDLYRVRYSLT